MNRSSFLFCIPLVAFLAAASEPLKSGPQPKDEVPGTFEILTVNGPDPGEKLCILCEYHDRPVAMVFAREISPTLVQLIKKFEASAAKNEAAELACCVILLGDEKELGKQLKDISDKEKLKHTLLGTFKAEGPKKYKIAAEADVTAITFKEKKVKANHVFKKGGMGDKEIAAIMEDVAKVVVK